MVIVVVLGGQYDIPNAYGGEGNDYFIISKYLTADVTIIDGGINTIVLDYGVEITGVNETTRNFSDTGLTRQWMIANRLLPEGTTDETVALRAKFELSTGGTIEVVLPTALAYQFQIGGGEAKHYLDIRDEFIDATADDPFIVRSAPMCR